MDPKCTFHDFDENLQVDIILSKYRCFLKEQIPKQPGTWNSPWANNY